VPDPVMAASLQHRQGTGEVAVCVGKGVVQGVAHPGLGTEVDHPIEPLPGTLAGKECRHGLPVREIATLEAKPGQRQEPGQARLLQAHLVVVVEIVETDHLVALLDEPLRQVKPDEAGGAGDEILHCAFSRMRACSRLLPRPMA